MKQTLIFTALPHQKVEEGGQTFLRVSVAISIRLEPDNNNATLFDFQEMLIWPEKILQGQYFFRFKNGLDIEAQLLSNKIDASLWHALMHDKIKVKGFDNPDFTKYRIHSYPVSHVNDFVLTNYQKFAISNPTKLLDTAEFIDENGLASISRYRPLQQKDYEKLKQTARRTEIKEGEVIRKDESTEKRFDALLRNRKFLPYQSASQPKMDFVQLRDFHNVNREGRKTPLAKIQKPEFEFHDILSVVSSYPQIQRKMALVLDFQIPLQGNIPNEGFMNLVPKNLDWDINTDISCPKTAFKVTKKGFYVRSKGNASNIDHGLLKINTPAFTVFQVDADGAALKLNNLVENKIIEDIKFKVVNINVSGSKTLKAKHLPDETPEEAGLPALRSAGIAIAKNGLSEHLHLKFQQVNNLNAKLLNQNKLDNNLKIILPDDQDALYADDTTQGYRMDVAYSDDPEKWYSLHWKQDQFTYFDKNNNASEITGIDPDEGFVQLGAAEDTESAEDIFVGEVMCRWEGWSLSVRKPGYAINEEDDSHDRDYVNTDKQVEQKKYQLDQDLEFKLNAIPSIVKGTLPKLRYGQEYMLRVRTVDLAGNSIGLEQQAEDPKKTVIRSFKYLRYEPTANPILLLGNELKDGEALEHVVVRSNYNLSTSEYEERYKSNDQKFEDNAQRYLLPPRHGQLMAECHGKFDKALGSNPEVAKTMYQLITSKEGLYEKMPDGKDKVYKENEVEIIYLPDPMGAGVSLFLAEGYNDTHTQSFRPRLFSFFTNDEITGGNTNINIPENDWYKGKYVKIRLVEGSLDAQWNAGQRTITVSMPKGQRTKLKFSTWWRADDIKAFSAVWSLLAQKKPGGLKELEKLAAAGKHWMISPGRELELVHAVQQPVEAPEILEIMADRNYDQTSAWINSRFKMHGFSTLKIDFKSKWKEVRDLPHHVEPEWYDRTGEIDDIQIEYHDKERQKGIFPQKQQNKPKKKTGEQKILVQAINLKDMALSQDFGDTKHRMVDYKPVGTSRYQEYFDKLIQQVNVPVTRDGTYYEKVIIPSSARPSLPEIDYVIPTFEWRKKKSGNTYRHRRLGGGLRIYLKRPWFSSGENEKLGVVLEGSGPINKKVAANIQGATVNYNRLVTQWGVDPIKLSYPSGRTGPRTNDFRYSPHIDKGVSYPGRENYKVDVAAYTVDFDRERKLWYADIAIQHEQMYFPFIKLALARYQQHSVRKQGKDVCLSEVVFPDFVQLVPERITTVDFKKDDNNAKFTITIQGMMSLLKLSPTNYFVITFLAPDLAQPQRLIIDDDTNDKKLTDEKVTITLTSKHIQNNFFTLSKEFKLPKKYKKDPFIIVIEEYERGTKSSKKSFVAAKAGNVEENQPRLVFADRFDINAKE
ncbi:hypothetical protein QQ008_03365 [Fulvivirgaceae bacterium BMA10]|uniref:Uncharacterized protein n=1 Tax=Splendidivirga corallicola TaxID=3051826 RepID=A0ABT8KI29_9BACT|nr:hypothetical protein [Fulvivirgaceae bacterium BMA10]